MWGAAMQLFPERGAQIEAALRAAFDELQADTHPGGTSDAGPNDTRRRADADGAARGEASAHDERPDAGRWRRPVERFGRRQYR